MKADLLRAAAAILVLLAPLSIASAQEFQYANQTAQNTPITLVGCGDCCNSVCDTCCNGGCDSCCNDLCCNSCCDDCCGGTWIADFEATFFKHLRPNLQTRNMSDYQFAPRIMLGYQTCDGLGVRVRYWDYNNTSGVGTLNGVANRVFNVDTFNIDAELFQTVQLTNCTSVEFSGGVRYNDFREDIITGGALTQTDAFAGFGGLFGIKARRDMLGGTVYARWNTAILTDLNGSTNRPGNDEFDSVLTQTELALGYERSYCLSNGMLVSVRAAYEWQVWTGYISDRTTTNWADVGFAGFVLGAGLQY